MHIPSLSRVVLALLPLLIVGSTSGRAQSVILSEPTFVTVASSASAMTQGAPITLTATVSTPQGGAVPGGTVQFVDETTLVVLGRAEASHPTIEVRGLSPGLHAIRADYSGTQDFLPLVVQPSQSAPLRLTVLSAPQMVLSSSHNPSAPGELVTLTVRVSGNGTIPTGVVTFRVGDEVLASDVALDALGVASFTTSALPEWPCTIAAEYHGDAVHAPAMSPALDQAVAAYIAGDSGVGATSLLARGM